MASGKRHHWDPWNSWIMNTKLSFPNASGLPVLSAPIKSLTTIFGIGLGSLASDLVPR